MSDVAAQVQSSISSLEQEFSIIAHNLANVSTPGYKRRCNSFSQVLSAQEVGTVTQDNTTVELRSAFDFTQGSIVETGRPLDFALVGEGFFVIETPDGPLYTRNGVFHLNENGQIVDSMGRIVAGQSGPISIPANISVLDISVSRDGKISAHGTAIGQFKLVDFGDDQDKLMGAGAHCFSAPEDVKPGSAGGLVVQQGFQESSNVQMVQELVDMMMVSRLYEANMQIVALKRDTSKAIIDVAMS